MNPEPNPIDTEAYPADAGLPGADTQPKESPAQPPSTAPPAPSADETTQPDASTAGTRPEAGDEPDSIEAIEAAADAERQKMNLPTLDESGNVPVYTGPDLWGSIRERIEKGPNLSGWNFDTMGFLGDLYGLGQAAIYGLGQGVQETGRTAMDLSRSPLTPGGAGQTMGRLLRTLVFENLFGKDSNAAKLNASYDTHEAEQVSQLRESLPNFAEILGVPKPDTALENIVATVAPFAASYWAGTKALEGLGLVSKLSSVQIPGLLGQGLGRLGVTGPGISRTMLEMLKSTAIGTTILPKDYQNVADSLNDLKGRDDALGSISRVWLNSVPGEKWLVHDASDDPLTAKFKNGLDLAYSEVVAPIAYLVARNTKILGLAAKGAVDSHVLGRAVSEQKLVQDVLEKLGKDSGDEVAMKWLFDKESMLNKVNHENPDVTYHDIFPNDLPEDTSALDIPTDQTPPAPRDPLHQSLKDRQTDFEQHQMVKNAYDSNGEPVHIQPGETVTTGIKETQPVPDAGLDESLPSFKNQSPVEQLKRMLTWSPEETATRIRNAQEAATAAERAKLADTRAYSQRYNTMADQAAQAIERPKFDTEGYLGHLNASLDDPAAFKRALGDWSQFAGGEPPPSLLTPKQLGVWDDTPMTVTGNVLDALKRLTTTDKARRADAARFLADMIGNGTLADDRAVANKLLDSTGEATSDVDHAARLLLTNRMYLEHSVIPDLHGAVGLLSKVPDDVPTQRLALDLMKQVNRFHEANQNIRSSFGRGLQSTQINPELEQSLREIYGPEQYRRYFNPGANPTAEASSILDEGAETANELLNESTHPLTASEKAQLEMLQMRWGVLEPGERVNFVSSTYRAGQHPFWKNLGNTTNFGIDLLSNMTMSNMLYAPATWLHVLSGAVSGGIWDPVSQVIGGSVLKETFLRDRKLFESVFRGAPIDATTAEIMQFGGLWRLLSLPHSMLVAAKSFVRPGWQELYGIGTTMYKSSPILGPEMIERSFGKDVAARMFTSGGGTLAGRALRTVGLGLGFPQHILGSIETMINHGALSGRLAEELYGRALTRGMKGGDARRFVFDNIPDLMEDALVAKSVPRGNVTLRNRAGFTVDELRNITDTAGEMADYSSMRESGTTAASPLATTKLSDTVPFALERGFTKWSSSLPVVGPLARSVFIPFGRVIANMSGRMLSPTQSILSFATRASGVPGFPSKYIDEVLGGLHGPNRQAQLIGHTTLAGALGLLGAANMVWLRNNGRDVSYPLGNDAQREAGSERGVRYGETLLPDGSTVTTQGFNPFVNFYNEGNYASWILGRYGLSPFLASSDPDQRQQASEAWSHVGQWASEAVPFAPLFQGLKETFGGAFGDSDNIDSINGALEGISGSVGKALGRPFRIPDLAPGQQVPGRSGLLHGQGSAAAFMSGAAGFSSNQNMYRINAYDLSGHILPDKYDPISGRDQFLEAFGLPSFRPYDDSPLGHFMGELESHGIAFQPQAKRQDLRIGGEINAVPINLQQWYNPKTHEHLWDIYNRFLSEQRTTSWTDRNNGTPMTVKAAMDELAADAIKRGEDGSHVLRVGNYRKRILSDTADKMQVNLAVVQGWARNELETYLAEHGNEFVDSDGNRLPDYAKIMYDSYKAPLPPSDEAPSVETTE